MSRFAIGALLLSAVGLGCALQAQPPVSAPSPYAKPAFAFADDMAAMRDPLPDDGKPIRLPGSPRTYYGSQFHALEAHFVPDWFPALHPAMPAVVVTGNRESKVFACALCHLPTGTGHPESGDLTGLGKDYITAQLRAFRDGSRKGAVKMAQLSKGLTDEEINAAATYFASLPPVKRVKVVEADNVPKSFLAKPGGARIKDPAGGSELLGQRLIEMADDPVASENHDPRVIYTAYVPKGAVERGKVLVESGGGVTQPCAACHGPGLRGQAGIPPLAGRSPTSLIRQLYLFQTGARGGAGGGMMKMVVGKLDVPQMVDIAAYTASLPKAAPKSGQ